MDTPAAPSAVKTFGRGRSHRDLTASAFLAAVDVGSTNQQDYLEDLLALTMDLASYNTVCETATSTIIGQRSGTLAGVPIVVKDNIDVAGFATTGGTPSLTGNRAESNAPLIERLIAAGAIVTAKNTMHELALGATSNNAFQGVPRNPWDPTRICGGSSGGTAGAVATGLAPVGIGTDTGGSIRMPAALCGLFGFRPSPGRYPEGGMLSLSPTRDTAGPLTRSMEDILLIDSVLASRQASTPVPAVDAIRLGTSPCHSYDLHPDVADSYARTLQTLQNDGVHFSEVAIGDIVETAGTIATTILWGEAEKSIQDYLDHAGGPSLLDLIGSIASPDVRLILSSGLGSVSERDYSAAIETRRQLRAELSRRLNTAGVQALMFPTVPVVAPLIKENDLMEHNGRNVPVFPTLIRHTDLGGVLGLPGISVPVRPGNRTGLPVGIEFTSPPETDDDLLALVTTLEPHISHVASPSTLSLALAPSPSRASPKDHP